MFCFSIFSGNSTDESLRCWNPYSTGSTSDLIHCHMNNPVLASAVRSITSLTETCETTTRRSLLGHLSSSVHLSAPVLFLTRANPQLFSLTAADLPTHVISSFPTSSHLTSRPTLNCACYISSCLPAVAAAVVTPTLPRQIPLKDFVGLDFTPTMEVEVELDSQAKAVVFRSTRSTLYGNVGKPGEEGGFANLVCVSVGVPSLYNNTLGIEACSTAVPL